MRKSGLQKQISSIFNEAPIPVSEVDSTSLPTPPAADTTAGAPKPASPAVAKAPSLAQRMAAAPTEAVQTPAAPALRPRPVTRSRTAAQPPKASLSAQLKKKMTGSGKTMDPRQKKMTLMVGVLSVVFAVVLFISLGGLGSSSATAAENKQTPPSAAVVKKDSEALQWHRPQPLTEPMRDPMKPAPKKLTAGQTGDSTAPSALIVKGIVFSKTRPTAIINEKIVAQGDTINGIKIVSIAREEVEFEQDGQRWTQPVQR